MHSPQRVKTFEDKVVIVTGGASGIGRASAAAFGKEGGRIVVADVDVREAERTVEMIRREGGQAMFVRCDVTRDDEVRAMVGETVERFGRLDVAFNNAGIEGTLAPLTEMTDETWQRVIATNLTGVWRCLRYELAQMQKQGFGAIVNNASILGKVGFPNSAAYTAAKHGVLGLTKVAALENAERGIRVNAVCPAFTETPMLGRAGLLSADARKALEAMHPVKRLGRPQEIAEPVLWLASNAASFVTGQAVVIDGGFTVQ